ncbi:UNVERIFIED_CONTAM: hypothetical protein Sangu_0312200 [Sesamum angustifolium]|uniref:Uncharacterized protein n=1 Tax=Sesamum angustifolium TaxID=2727405 RepID=A0AAW2QQX7_9LAMI
MEAMKMKMVAFASLIVMLSAVNGVSAAHAPAPAPTSDATLFVPTLFASFAAMAFALLF